MTTYLACVNLEETQTEDTVAKFIEVVSGVQKTKEEPNHILFQY